MGKGVLVAHPGIKPFSPDPAPDGGQRIREGHALFSDPQPLCPKFTKSLGAWAIVGWFITLIVTNIVKFLGKTAGHLK